MGWCGDRKKSANVTNFEIDGEIYCRVLKEQMGTIAEDFGGQ
jgi:hypothetical protein